VPGKKCHYCFFELVLFVRTGKSFILSNIAALNVSGLYKTAMTGIAAVPIQGQTLHSFAGIGKGDFNDDWLSLVTVSC
jgi:hypothetical protein